MSTRTQAARYSRAEEIANSITHGVGLLLAIGALATMTALAALHGNAWHIVGCSVFGATLVLSYLTSTLYHSLPTVRAKSVLRVLDHCAIFLLIAGTYTPFMLVNLRGPWGWSLFGVIWAVAALGIVFKVTMLRRWTAVSVVLYVAMGWVVVVAIKPMLSAVAPGGLLLLLLGGVAYTAGVGFYAWRRMPYHHAIWHLFVLAGSVFHFFAVLLYVIPLSNS
jgi:hemolysin III